MVIILVPMPRVTQGMTGNVNIGAAYLGFSGKTVGSGEGK